MASASLAAFALTIYKVTIKKEAFPESGNFIFLGIFLLLFLCSAYLTPYKEGAKYETIFILSSLSLFFAVLILPMEDKLFLQKSAALSTAIAALLYVSAWATGGEVSARDRTELFINDNVLASFIGAGIFLTLGLWKDSKAIWSVILIVLFSALLISQSVLAIFSLSLAAILVIRRRKFKYASAAGFFILGIVLFIKSPWLHASLGNRLRWWGECWNLILLKPFLGHGPASFESVSGLVHNRGTLGSLYAHSFPLQEAVEVGIPALFFLAFFLKKQISKMENPFILGAAAVLLTHGLFDFSMNIHGIFLFFFIILALGSSPV